MLYSDHIDELMGDVTLWQSVKESIFFVTCGA